VRCWGYGLSGQLGNGMAATSPTPVPVSGITNAVEVSAGGYTSCARLADGTARCWGADTNGALGNDALIASSNTPVPVSGIANAAGLASGFHVSGARLASGTMSSWGHGQYGQMGNGLLTITNPTPVATSGIDYIQVSSFYQTVCGVRAGGSAYCWGANSSGQVGDGTTGPNKPSPTPVSGLSTVTKTSNGTFHSCAVLANGTARCWGDNGQGRLGDGTTNPSAFPITPLYLP
jgi:alpha-tubulin suppressor-like RCC1 family protein